MSCGSGIPAVASGFRPAGGPQPHNARNLARRHAAPARWRVFSTRLDRLSAVLQNPTRITLRELVLLVFAVFALYEASFAADRVYDLLARRDVSQVCRGATAMACLRHHLLLCTGIVLHWAGAVVPWGLFGVVVVLVGEALLRRG